MQTRILDCTLRDGGHVNDGAFGREAIAGVISALVDAKIDIIEFALYKPGRIDSGNTFTEKLIELLEFIPAKSDSKFVFMVRPDWGSIEKIPNANERVNEIRLAFRINELNETFDAHEHLKAKGYKIHFNPIDTPSIELNKLQDLIKSLSLFSPETVSIVDTNGGLYPEEFNRIVSVYEDHLDRDIAIGLHLHDNLGLSHSLALEAVEKLSNSRSLIIDSAITGLGRKPGNLKTEIIAHSSNRKLGKDYKIEPLAQATDKYLIPLSKIHPYGYGFEYALSAQYEMDRSIAEFLRDDLKKDLDEISQILMGLKQAGKIQLTTELQQELMQGSN